MLGLGLSANKRNKSKGNIIKDGLVLNLDGRDFSNYPPTSIWKDRSPLANNATPSGFGYIAPYASVTSDFAGTNQNVIEYSTGDGKIHYEVEGETQKNEIANGNFSSGTTGWISGNSAQTVLNNTLTNTANGLATFPQSYSDSRATCQTNKKVYAKAKIRVTNSNCTVINFNFRGSTSTGGFQSFKSISTPIANTWYDCSGIVTIDATQIGLARVACIHNYIDNATANGKVMEVQQVMLVDLTTKYGAGNEPTQAQCDIIYANWFDGVKSVGEDVGGAGVHKINVTSKLQNGSTGDTNSLTLANPLRKLSTTVFDKYSEGVVNRSTGKVVYNGGVGENWSSYSAFTNVSAFSIALPNGGTLYNEIAISDKFKNAFGSTVTTLDEECVTLRKDSGLLFIKVLKTKLATQDVAGFKTWLASNITTVIYELPTPTTENITVTPINGFANGSLLVDGGVIPAKTNFLISLLSASSGSWLSADKTNVTLLNGTCLSVTSNVLGSTPQIKVKFNVIAFIESKYGTLPCASDLASKVVWVRNNINSITCNCYVYGLNSSGNKAYLQRYSTLWIGGASNTNSSPTSIASAGVSPEPISLIQSDGFIHFITYTNPTNVNSSGVFTPSTINMDYVNLQITFKTPSGSDGMGRVVFDSVDDRITIPNSGTFVEMYKDGVAITPTGLLTTPGTYKNIVAYNRNLTATEKAKNLKILR